MVKSEIPTYKEIYALFKGSGKTKKEIESKVKEKEDEIRKRNPKLSDEIVMELLFNTIYSERKRDITDVGGSEFILQVIWGGEPFDWVKAKKAEMDAVWKNNRKEAIAKKMFKLEKDGGGRVVKKTHLYWWDKNAKGEENQMKGQPLPDSSHLRTIGGIGMKVGDGDWKKFTMEISNDFADPDSELFKKVVYNKMLEVTCTLVEEGKDSFLLRARGNTYFNNPSEGYELDPNSIGETYADNNMPLENIEDEFSGLLDWKSEHSRGSHKLLMSRCLVIQIDPPLSNRSAIVYVDSPKRALTTEEGEGLPAFACWWKETLPINFGKDSLIYLFYEVSQTEKKENNEFTGDWNQITFTALGYVPLYVTEKDKVPLADEPIDSEEEYIPELDEAIGEGEIEEEFSDLIVDEEEEIEDDDLEL